MARRRRYHLSGATYHVMLRGNDGQPIYYDDADRCRMCLLMQEGLERFGHRVFAYCFMTNHLHLAIQVGQIPLSRIMQNLAFRYTRYVNSKMRRIGHLFQGRFKSILVDSDRYLWELIRYIHLNPVRASMVRIPDEYRWSSHNVYLGRSDLAWLDPTYILTAFGGETVDGLSSFQQFVHSGIDKSDDTDFKRGSFDGILGDDEFVERVREQAEEMVEPDVHIGELLHAVADLQDINVDVIREPGKARFPAHVRALLAFIVRESESLTLEELAKEVGRDASSLSKAAARLSRQAVGSEALRRELEDLRAYVSQMPECQA